VLNAVIFSRNFQSLPDARSWEGKTIKVRGQVRLYKGKPEIILERPGVTVEVAMTEEAQAPASSYPPTERPCRTCRRVFTEKGRDYDCPACRAVGLI
jgi:hypothetical protein